MDMNEAIVCHVQSFAESCVILESRIATFTDYIYMPKVGLHLHDLGIFVVPLMMAEVKGELSAPAPTLKHLKTHFFQIKFQLTITSSPLLWASNFRHIVAYFVCFQVTC